MDTPRVTVAVSTYGRAALLPRLVAALAGQTLPKDEYEVVVVDDASPDGTADVLRDLARTAPFRLTVLRNDANRGPAHGRNAAWRAGRGGYVAFTDDDCLPRPDWLAHGLAAAEQGHRVVVGRTEPNPEQAGNAGPFSRTVRVDDTRHFQTCNVVYRRADLDAVGGFDEAFRRTSGEDVDLGLRVVAHGATPWFAADAVVWHDVRPRSLAEAVRETRRWSELPRVVRVHPGSRRTIAYRSVFWKRSHAEVYGLLAGAALARRHPAALLLGVPYARSAWRRSAAADDPAERAVRVAGNLAVDAAEVAVLAAGSARHRSVFL